MTTIWRRIRGSWIQWRIRPGLLYAAQIAEETAWSNKNTWALGPENNLMKLAQSLRMLANM